VTELEFLRLQVRGIPVHTHKSPKRGEWFCRSPYCTDLASEVSELGPTDHPDKETTYDLGALNA